MTELNAARELVSNFRTIEQLNDSTEPVLNLDTTIDPWKTAFSEMFPELKDSSFDPTRESVFYDLIDMTRLWEKARNRLLFEGVIEIVLDGIEYDCITMTEFVLLAWARRYMDRGMDLVQACLEAKKMMLVLTEIDLEPHEEADEQDFEVRLWTDRFVQSGVDLKEAQLAAREIVLLVSKLEADNRLMLAM
jgi:hypothetical protein